MTKPIISFAVMQLIEKNYFSLNDTIDKFLPEFKKIKVLNSIGKSLKDTKPAQNIPSISQLLQHTAGFTYNDCGNILAEEYDKKKIFHSITSTLEEEIEIISQLPLLFEPGSKWHYSISIDILARIIEIVTNDKIINFLNENIFNPLEMKNTKFYINKNENSNLVETIQYNKINSKLSKLNFNERKLILYGYPKNNVNYSRGGHGLYSTAEDFIKFSNMLLDGKNKKGNILLSKQYLEMMKKNIIKKELFPLEIISANTIKDNKYQNDLDGYGWGLGFRVLMNNTNTNKNGTIGEFGWSGYASTYFLVDPIKNFSAVLMMQILDADNKIKNDFYNNIYKNFS